jgi:hypothetical protein
MDETFSLNESERRDHTSEDDLPELDLYAAIMSDQETNNI